VVPLMYAEFLDDRLPTACFSSSKPCNVGRRADGYAALIAIRRTAPDRGGGRHDPAVSSLSGI
jgi:hypothetical protein